MNIKSHKDFFSGLLFMAAGVAFAWGASFYGIGSAARMGPGYFPLGLGVLLALLGSVITFKALVVETEDGGKMAGWAWKPLFFILEANVVFGLMLGGFPHLKLPPMGLIAGIYALTFIASQAGGGFRFKEVLALATVLAGLSYLAFIVLLKMPLPVWPAFLTA
jgi:hypothetical protein